MSVLTAAAWNRVRLCLDGLSLGDAFGEQFFRPAVLRGLAERQLPPGPWPWTDDTAMAWSVAGHLRAHGEVDPAGLAAAFARAYRRDPHRGYGSGAHQLLQALLHGEPWEPTARGLFGGQGSMGNGGGMRSAVVGAAWAGDLDAVVVQATRSAQPTHAHAEGVAGAVAVAVVTAVLAEQGPGAVDQAWTEVLARTPGSQTREGLVRARALPVHASVGLAAAALGTGERVLAQDTVPFAVWSALRDPGDLVQALWRTVDGLGDRDTTCAMVGGMLAPALGPTALPAEWLHRREPLWPWE